MKIVKTTIAFVALSAMAFGAVGVANANSLDPAGWTAGLALGGALPEGVYFVDTASIGGWRGIDDHESSLGINVPLVLWSTPYQIAGGRIEVIAAAPEISGDVPGDRNYTAMYNPAGFVGAAWNLGGGFHVSAFLGGWAPVDNELAKFGFNSWVFSEKVNLAYLANGWKLAANLTFGQPGDTQSTTLFGKGQIMPGYFNYDLTASKTIGKWELGVVAFGSTDTSSAPWNTALGNGGKQSQFAMGGLVGYSFPGITTQLFVTRDLVSENYFNLSDGSKSYETRIWTRAIIPLWNPEAPLK